VTSSVFVSRPSVLTREQAEVADRWEGTLGSMGLEMLTLTDCPAGRSLWDELRLKLGLARGAVIFGMRQLRVDDGCWRPGTAESTNPWKWWTTPWNQLEAGMAIMLGLPVLALREDGVDGGIFDPTMWGNGVFGADLEGSMDDHPVTSWLAAVGPGTAWLMSTSGAGTLKTLSKESVFGSRTPARFPSCHWNSI
jgi:hypothetical protein